MYHLDSSNLEDFETHDLLDAIDHLDMARNHLGDGVNHEPPELRKDLFRLHTALLKKSKTNQSYSFLLAC